MSTMLSIRACLRSGRLTVRTNERTEALSSGTQNLGPWVFVQRLWPSPFIISISVSSLSWEWSRNNSIWLNALAMIFKLSFMPDPLTPQPNLLGSSRAAHAEMWSCASFPPQTVAATRPTVVSGNETRCLKKNCSPGAL